MNEQATIERLQAQIAELTERLAQFEAKTGFMSAQAMYDAGVQWVTNNPRAWRYIREYAQRCVNEQRRFSMKKALEELRDSDLIDSDELYKVNNSYSAVLTRLLCARMPGLRDLTTMRRSKVDRLFKNAG